MTTLIEKTSKKYKNQMLQASMVIILGFVSLGFSTTVSIVLIFGGLVWLVVANMQAWWHHG